jgi:ribosome-binding protein aMBF1 (putative translation factor)
MKYRWGNVEVAMARPARSPRSRRDASQDERRAVLRAFGAQLKRYRRAAGLTQAALAERIGRGRIYIAQLEGAAREPSLVTLGRLARALQVPVGVLLELPGSGE